MKFIKTSIFFLILTLSNTCFSNVSLPAVFSDNMVLQRNADVKIWGWAQPGEVVKINTTWSEEEVSTKAGRNGTWELILQTPDVRDPQEIGIKGYNTILLKNVLLGEVWLVSGQSNMEWSAAAGIDNAVEAIAEAKNPNLRFFSVAHRTAGAPQQDLDGEWVSSTSQTMEHFSAVAYFFGKKLTEELGVPVGLINSSWGGTPAEVWMPEETIATDPILSKAAALLPEEEWGPKESGIIYNAMIAPLIPFELAGVLWYQGESNTANAKYYESIFSSLIKSWRQKWDKELPFYYAQIAPYDYGEGFSGVEIRDAQRRVLELSKTGMVMTSDIGNIKDIHPRNKKDVGLRFANLALTEVYEIEKPAYAPVPDRIEQKNKELWVYFKNSEGLKIDKENKDSQFEIAGENGIFHPAKVKLKNDVVRLGSKGVKNPKYVRFSWGNTSTSNLFNKAGLPASSFLVKIE